MPQRTGEIRPFFETLRELRGGAALDDLAAQLNELVDAVRRSELAGSLTLTLKVKPASKGGVVALIVTDEIKAKLPKAPSGATVFFADPDNNLRRTNPDQPELELRVAGEPAAATA